MRFRYPGHPWPSVAYAGLCVPSYFHAKRAKHPSLISAVVGRITKMAQARMFLDVKAPLLEDTSQGVVREVQSCG